jgi:hypothetical protein
MTLSFFSRLSFSLVLPLTLLAHDSPTPQLITMDYADLVTIRGELAAKGSNVQPAYNQLLEYADKLLDIVPPSVMDKTMVPPSGDKHDFFAIGNYSWPNPDTKNGLPYIRRDGHKNPGATDGTFDKQRYDQNAGRIKILALAWFYSRDEKYAAKAADLLRTWFLDPETRMNPNLNFAASQPGVQDGSFYGIIEGVQLIGVVDHVKLLNGSASWTDADDQGLKKWFTDFTVWLRESEFGKTELARPNNHGTWCAAQIAAYSLYSNLPKNIAPMITRGRELVAHQIAPDGSLPEELRRSRSLMYSCFALRALMTLARCGELAGDDLWHYRTEDGRGLENAFTFLAPYLSNTKVWTWPSLDNDLPRYAKVEILRWSARVYQTPVLKDALNILDPVWNPEIVESLSAADKENWTIWLVSPLPR